MKEQKYTITVSNVKVVRETQKALLIAFPEGNSQYAVWFPKSKVTLNDKNATIELIGDEYQVILSHNITYNREELAKAFETKLEAQEKE